jgi:asparagine synthase (glutamine-hydrolysing)
MCGIVGTCFSRHEDVVIERMKDAISYRGPDDHGIWVDHDCEIALGHRRLSIHDLSIEGHQPMHSSNGQFVIVFNGEIYNFLELRKELEDCGCYFRGHSDTEVMLAAIEQWDIDGALQRFVGMFAFALWDKKERVLSLARDRLGEKPLYYGWQRGNFLFASELKALRVHPDWQGDINRDAITLYMRHQCIPAPYSVFTGIFKLMPGTYLSIPYGADVGFLPDPEPYWQAKEVAESGVKYPFEGTDSQAVDALDGLLRDVIRDQMVADVPLGAFLSGGVDSSTVAALMQLESDRPVKTFSIGFDEDAYNEAEHAKLVAEHIGAEHTELYVTADQAMEVIPQLPYIYDEPFSDCSQIPTFLVSQMTRQHVTVALSGDGGDELFAGYNRYFWGQKLWRKFSYFPKSMRSGVAAMMQAVSPGRWDDCFDILAPLFPTRFRQQQAGDKIHKLAGVLAVESPEAMYCALISCWKNVQEIVLSGHEPLSVLTDQSRWADLSDFVQRMQLLDTISYLPDDILTKVDRAAMAVSLETRVPFLDHRVVEFSWQLPMSMKVRHGQGKWLLRQVLYRYVPDTLIERPKMGFGVPIDSWLRGPLRDWAEDLLDESRLRNEGVFDPVPIREKWLEHLSGRRNWQYLLWNILMFQAWLEYWKMH